MAQSKKQLIKDTFVELLEERPLAQITVKDVVAASGINRNTFYYHFEDMPALIEEIVMDEVSALISKYPSFASMEECMNVAVEFALANRRIALHLYNSSNREIFEHYLMQIIDHVVTTYLGELCKDKDIDARDFQIVTRYYKCLLTGLIIDWMECGMNSDVRDDFARLMEIYKGIPEEIITRITR